MNEDIKKINEVFNSLPEKVKNLILSQEYENILIKIGQSYNLNSDTINILSRETTLLMMGINGAEDFENELRNELSLSQEILDKILGEIGESLSKIISQEENKTISSGMNEDLDSRFNILSPTTRQAILESKYHQKLYDIAQTYNLSVTQMGSLEKDTTDTIVGTTRPEKFEEVLKRSLGLGDEQNKKLVGEINDKILRKIREKLMGAEPHHQELMEEIPEAEIILTKTPVVAPEISERKPDLTTPELPAGNKSLGPMLAQKLAAKSFQIPSTKTDHSLNNISKAAPQKEWSKMDPYRELPE